MLREKAIANDLSLVFGAVSGGCEAECSHRALKAKEGYDTSREGGESKVAKNYTALYFCFDGLFLSCYSPSLCWEYTLCTG